MNPYSLFATQTTFCSETFLLYRIPKKYFVEFTGEKKLSSKIPLADKMVSEVVSDWPGWIVFVTVSLVVVWADCEPRQKKSRKVIRGEILLIMSVCISKLCNAMQHKICNLQMYTVFLY